MTEWKLVPIEPTEEMIRAFSKPDGFQRGYVAMLAAAPLPPSTPDVDALVEIGWQAARKAWITSCNMMEAVKAAVRAILPHLRAPARGYTVRWDGNNAYIGEHCVGEVYQVAGQWVWCVGPTLTSTEYPAPSEAAAKLACEAAIHKCMAGFGLVPVPTEGTFREGVEAAARWCDAQAQALGGGPPAVRAKLIDLIECFTESATGIRALATKREG